MYIFLILNSHQGSPTILQWVAYPFSSRSPQVRNWTRVSCFAGGFFTSWDTINSHRVFCAQGRRKGIYETRVFSPLSMSVSLEVTTIVVPNLFGTRDQFRERQFSHRSAVGVGSGQGGWLCDDSSTLHLLCLNKCFGSPRILQWVACPFSSRSPQPRNQTRVSCFAGGFFTSWDTREVP